ncbi:MAG TPA: LysM domain-containing protein [Anaerolineaceae bacterium]|nr:LysM domain-containing protein [Anaerolineaceae bacterium]
MNPKTSPGSASVIKPAQVRATDVVSVIWWGVAGIMVIFVAALFVWRPDFVFASAPDTTVSVSTLTGSAVNAQLPAFAPEPILDALVRQAVLHTDLPEQKRFTVEEYRVELGDSLFAISKTYDLKPDSILWANYSTLNDNPDLLSLDMTLKIPPTDGVLYEWKDGDTPEAVAAK